MAAAQRATKRSMTNSFATLWRIAVTTRRLYWVGGIIIAAALIAAVVVVLERRQQAIKSYEREISNLSVVLAEQTARTMQALDLVIRETQSKIRAAGIGSPEQFAHSMTTEEVHRFFADRLAALPQADGIGLVDVDGRMINGSRLWPMPRLDVSDRDYYRHFRDHDDPGVFISDPVRNRLTGARSFFLARRIDGPHEEFLGIAVGVIKINYFEEFYRAITLQDGGSVTLLRRDGTILARHPRIENLIGQKLSTQSAWYSIIDRGGGKYRTAGYIDGVARLVATRPLRDYPLAVAVTVAESAALAPWRAFAFFVGAGTVCSVICFGGLFAALAASSRRTERQTAALAEAADALQQSEERFRDFATTSSDWFWETDAEHRMTYVSDGIRAFGQDPHDFTGRSRIDNAAPSDTDHAKWEEHIATLNRREPFRNFVYTVKFGDQPTVSISGKPFFDEAGRFLGYRGTGRDVTAEFLAERRLQEAKNAAETASVVKSQFLANMSHELRTPLNAIIGFAELLELGIAGPLSPRQIENIRIIRQSGDHLHNVINDILDLAKVEAGKLELRDEHGVDPRRIIDACVQLVKERVKEGGLSLAADVDPELPLLVADSTRLKQILLNLLSNATKFTEAGGSIVVAGVRTRSGGVAFQVRDTGVGMTPDEIEIALEPFGQIDAGLARRYEGTGLGLPLARRLAELHGGSLRVTSRRGRGTKVTVSLPAARVIADPAPRAAADAAV
jgi:PAS domain S-box-containing protein